MAATVRTFEEYELDVERFELRRAGELVAMEPQVFQVLAYLVEHNDRVVLKDEIIGHLWPDGFISDGALNTRVMDARKAVGDTGKEQRLLRTVRSRGYRFVGEVVERPRRQAAAAGAELAAMPLEADAGGGPYVPLGLDVAATSFVGREAELAQLVALLEQPGCRLVTIAGPGGMGKTRLADALAHRLRQAGRDVAVAALESIGSNEELIVALAGALGIRLREESAAAIAGQAGGRETVLVLDNFEQLIEAGATTVGTLVTRTPALRIVVTSREALGLREEWLFPVGGLAVEQASPGESPAVQLFLDREAQAGAATATGDAPLEPVREICRLLDGMPLGLELAASLRRYLSRAEVLERVLADATALQSEARNLPARHRSLGGLLEETVRHLAESQRATLFSLAVFEGSFTLDAAASVAGAPLSAVAELVDRSLVQARNGRYALHPLLRQYGRSRLGDGIEPLRRGHAEYFSALLAARRQALEQSHQAAVSAEIEQDFANVLAAWRWACSSGRLDLVEEAAYPLYLYAHLRSRWAELRAAFDQAAAIAGQAGNDWWRTLGLLQVMQTWALIRTAPGPAVVEAQRRAEALFERHGELPPPGLATDTMAIRALIDWSAGRYGRMQESAREAAERARRRSDIAGEVYALWLGAVARNRVAELRWVAGQGKDGRYGPAGPEAGTALSEAGELLAKAASLLSEQGERWFRAAVLYEQALTAKARGDREIAVQLTEQAYELRAEFGDSRGMAEALISLVGSYTDAANAERADCSLREAQATVARLGDPIMTSELLRARALHSWLRNEHSSALHWAAEAADLSLQIGSVNNVLGSLRLVAHVFEETGEVEAAAGIHAFVAGHPASPPFARARSEAAIEAAAATLPASAVEAMRLEARSAALPEFTASVLGRVAAHPLAAATAP